MQDDTLQKIVDDSGRALMHTVSGCVVDLLDPDPGQITLEDIAHHLSIEPRFGGGTQKPFAVASHCLRVAMLCETDDAPCPMEGLMHDASEYLLKDIPKPLKRLLGDAYRVIERRLEVAIARKFGLSYDETTAFGWPDLVHRADAFQYAVEEHELRQRGDLPSFADFDLQPRTISRLQLLPPETVKGFFLARFRELNSPNRRR